MSRIEEQTRAYWFAVNPPDCMTPLDRVTLAGALFVFARRGATPRLRRLCTEQIVTACVPVDRGA